MIDDRAVRQAVEASLRSAGVILEEEKYPPVALAGCILTPEVAQEVQRVYELFHINPLSLVHTCTLRAQEVLLPLVWLHRDVSPVGEDVPRKVHLARTFTSLEQLVLKEAQNPEVVHVPLTPLTSGILHAYAAAFGCSVHVVTNFLIELCLPGIYEEPWQAHPVDVRLQEMRDLEDSNQLIHSLLREPRNTFVAVPEVTLMELAPMAQRAKSHVTTLAWKVLTYRVPLLLEMLEVQQSPRQHFKELHEDIAKYWQEKAHPALEGLGVDPDKAHRIRISQGLSEILALTAELAGASKAAVALVALGQECSGLQTVQQALAEAAEGSTGGTKEVLRSFLEAQERTIAAARASKDSPAIPDGARRKVTRVQPRGLVRASEEDSWPY